MARIHRLKVKQFVADPEQPMVSEQGTPGEATVGYRIVALDEDGNATAASPEGSSTSSAEPLDDDNFNRVTWSPVPGAVAYEVWRTTGGPSQGFIATTESTTYDDVGVEATAGEPPTENGTGIGEVLDVGGLHDLTVQVGGTFEADLNIEGSINGEEFLALNAVEIDEPVLLRIEETVDKLRVRQVAYTSGTPTVYVAGRADD